MDLHITDYLCLSPGIVVFRKPQNDAPDSPTSLLYLPKDPPTCLLGAGVSGISVGNVVSTASPQGAWVRDRKDSYGNETMQCRSIKNMRCVHGTIAAFRLNM